MPRRPLESLGAIVRDKRGRKKLRETAREIGIGPATLMRIESGRVPDLETFGKTCRWLKMDPADFLGINPAKKSSPEIATHFKADKTPQPETVQALVQMILKVLSTQPGLSDPKS